MLAAGLAAVSSIASGYAHWLFYANDSVPFNSVPAIFNLGSLANDTVSYFISDQTPTGLMPGDSVANVVSQIQAAAAVWNTVPTSTVRLAFGGYSAIGAPQTAPQATPGIDVVFDDDDVPPGLAALTRLTWLSSDVNAVANGASFVPIRRSTISLRHELGNGGGGTLASYDDVFFLIVAHEFGHALGLQHTLTSGLMATTWTSATTKAIPLSPDDIAGISLLYPTQTYQQGTGSISGSVLVNGNGVNLANVVALSASGVAVSTLTNPDGTYQIQGVPPGQYYVYAGPLPPPQVGEATPDNIVPPEDSQGNPFNAQTGFDTEFAPGTRDLSQATVVTVTAGVPSTGIDCTLQPRSNPTFNYVETWGYVGSVGVPSPPLLSGSREYLLFGGPTGIASASALVPGLSATVIGAAAVEPKTLAFESPYYAEIVVDPGQVQNPQPVALVVTTPSDMYVLPYAFSVVPTPPPSITGVNATTDALGNTTVNLQGANLNSSTSVVFDGAAAPLLSVNSDGSLTVAAPPASAGYTAYIEALSPAGQTSWQDLGNATPPSFTYSAPQNPSFIVNYAQLFPGATSMIDIIGTNTSFSLSGCPVSIGTGTSDITVGQVWVLPQDPGVLLANVAVRPQAQPGPVDVTVSCGLQTLTIPGGLQVQAANPAQVSMLTPILNQATGLPGTPAGGVAVITCTGLPQNVTGWTVLFDYQIPSTVQMQNGNQLYVPIPASVAAGGAAVVQLIPPNSNIVIPAVVMQVDLPDPVITAAVNASGNPISSTNPVHVGDTMTLTVSGLTQSATGAGLNNTQVVIGGLQGGAAVAPLTISPTAQADTYEIQFTLGPDVPYGPDEAVQVGIGTRVSAPFNLFILPAAANQ